MFGTTAISIVKFFFNEEKRWLNRETGKEWRKIGGRVSRILQQSGKEKWTKRKGEKKRLSKRQSLQ
jgi:hypothetical protein